MSESLRNPQLEPSDHAWVILQDHGPQDGGWGPAAVAVPPFDDPRPFLYTGSDEQAIAWAKVLCRELAQRTGKPTILARYSSRDDVFKVEGSS